MRLAQKTTSVRTKMAIQTILARMSQCPCKRVSPRLCRSVPTRASLGADRRFIPAPLFKPIGQMVNQKEAYDDLVYKLWLTQIVYYHTPSQKRYKKRYELPG